MDIIKSLIALVLFTAALTSCAPTRYVPVESVRTETRDVVREVATVDTLRLETYVYDRGDTVFIARDRWRTRYAVERDTVTVVRTDSVAVPYPVERELTAWERTRLDYGGYALLCLAVVLVAAVVWLVRAVMRRR